MGNLWDRSEARPASEVDLGIHSLDEYLRCRENWSTDIPASVREGWSLTSIKSRFIAVVGC